MEGRAIKGRGTAGRIFVISGPSGSGKTTLLDKLLEQGQLKSKLVKSVSFTTRPRRPGEQEGRNYFFISERQFQRERQTKKIIEWTRYLGHHYATPKCFVTEQLKQGKHVLLCLDLKGASRIKRFYPKNTITIFVMPPSIEVLRDRIQKRCDKTQDEEIQKRLKLARKEVLFHRRYDYCLVNKGLTDTVKNLRKIVSRETERSR